MSKIIKTKKIRNFSQIDNSVLDDTSLKPATLGILCYLLGKPSDWRFSVISIAKAFGVGKDMITTAMADLQNHGYASKKPNPKGGWDWTVYENPTTENPSTENPSTENPSTENPSTENPSTENPSTYNKYTNYTNIQKPPILNSLPHGEAETEQPLFDADADAPCTDDNSLADTQSENLFSNNTTTLPAVTEKPKRQSKAADPAKRAANVACREAYALAYQARYGIAPVANAKLNSQVSKFVEYVGRDDAPAIAKHYLTDNSYLYVQSGHDFGLLLRDCQKIRQQWYTGKRMTHSEAKQADATQARLSQFDELVAAFESGEVKGWD